MKNILEDINEAVKTDATGFIKECDGEYFEEIRGIAQYISDHDEIMIVAIAGPSASGKTTTAHIMCELLNRLGENTAVVSLDDFYFPKECLPKLPDGRTDIESVNALDVNLIEKCFKQIISEGKCELPQYDFKTHSRLDERRKIDIGSRGIIVVEGLHALNPVICDRVPRENIYKIYISVNRAIYGRNGTRLLSSRQVRLVRRILRDSVFRGSDVNQTLTLWSDVVSGETKYLYKFKDTADVQLVTLHSYELCAYRDRFCALKDSANEDSPSYSYFIGAVNSLEKFLPLDASLIPQNSLIREFIG